MDVQGNWAFWGMLPKKETHISLQQKLCVSDGGFKDYGATAGL